MREFVINPSIVHNQIKTGFHAICPETPFVINTIIHNAAVLEPCSLIRNAKAEEWQDLFQVNLFAAVTLAQWMLSTCTTSSKFIMVSSGAAINPYDTWGAYCASKAAANMFIQTLALEEKEKIIALAVRPGVVNTDMQSTIRTIGKSTGMSEETFTKFKTIHEQGKLLRPEQPGNVIADLALVDEQSEKWSRIAKFSGKFLSWDDPLLSHVIY